jgi:hypothetical protein
VTCSRVHFTFTIFYPLFQDAVSWLKGLKKHKHLVQYNQYTGRDFNPALSEHI